MLGWTLVDTHPTQGHTFHRPLAAFEYCLFWDGLFSGTGDILHHYEVRLSNVVQDVDLFSDANIVRAWLSTKRRYPLAGATVRDVDDASLRLKAGKDLGMGISTGCALHPHFVIREHDLVILRPREIIFGQVTDAEEVHKQALEIVHGPRPISEELLMQLYVFRETGSERTDVIHLMIMMAHCVTDGTANRTFVRCLFDTLARSGEVEPVQVSLEERLEMMVPPMDLAPKHLRLLSPARRRWRRAAGVIIFQLRMAKSQGGHTLPCRRTHSTMHVTARSGTVSTLLSPTQTAAVIANCRLHNLTFGSAYLVLAQVAMTRVLYRRYIRGEISEEEWAYRRRQPHINGGPLNLRRYLDKAWFNKGGGGEFMLCIGTFIYQLPFMTLGEAEERHQRVLLDGAPPFSDLLTFERFLHRAGLVKKQATTFSGHPLFLEILHAMYLAYLQYARFRAMEWMRHTETAIDHGTHGDSDKVLAVTDIPMVWAHGGSSLGNVDLISPIEYPLPSTHPLSPYCSTPHPFKAGYVTPTSSAPSDSEANAMPKFVVENSRVHLRTHPAELYLGAATSRGQMNIYVHYDANVFEEEVAKEWLDEVREAVLWYLGRTRSDPDASG